MYGGELAEQLVLRGIGVLELVHQDVAKASSVSLQDVVALLEQLADPDDQVAEIDGVRRLQRRLVAPVHFKPGLPGYVVVRYAHIGGEQAGVLPAIDAREMLARGADVEPEIAGRPFCLRQLIRIVVNGEAPGEAESFGLAPEDPRTCRMKRRDPQALRVRANQLLYPLAKLSRGLVRERDRQDLGRPGKALAEQVRDPVREHAGLPGAGARQDEQGTFAVADRFELRRIEEFGQRIGHQRCDNPKDGTMRRCRRPLRSASFRSAASARSG